MRVEIRADKKSIGVSGYVNVVGRDSRVLHDKQGPYIEQVMPGAFAKVLAACNPVELHWNHQKTIGSTEDKNQLELWEDNIGLHADSNVTDEDVISAAENQELRWSFGFVKRKGHWKTDDDGTRHRFTDELELREVSILDKTPAYIATSIETRAESNMTVGDNGAVIPSSIARKIIQRIHDTCPIYALAPRYNVGGTLSSPYYDEVNGAITMGYSDEFVELKGKAAKLKSIELNSFLAGALSKVSKSLVNNSAFDIVIFVINVMADSGRRWIEGELLKGTADKVAGLITVTQIVTAAAATAVTADELIDTQEAVPDAYQNGTIWIMNRATRTAIRKLKDNDGNYLLNRDVSAKWSYTLLGRDVHTSDNMPKMEAGNTAIYYGDMSGLALNVSEEMNLEVLWEKYATQHAVGVVMWIEPGSKVENAQKISVLKMKAGA